jgi:hypothetical protein
VKKANQKDKNTPTEAILTPGKQNPQSGVNHPGVENVRRAKHFVDENKK